jgi:hypothetical protein
LGLNPSEFWELTLRDFIIKTQAYRQKLEEWERVVRLQTYWIVSPNIKPDAKAEPKDLWTLPSEREEVLKKQQKDALEAEKAFARAIGIKL